MKVLITGGHYTPALAVIDELRDHDIVFVGRKFSIESDDTESPEFKEVRALGIKFIPLNTGKINRFFSLGTFFNLLRIFKGLKQAKEIIKEEKPDVVLSFGSYIGVPICIQAWIKKIPIYTHEQTIRPGLSNRFISLMAKKVFISFDKTKKYFPKFKVILTGNPIRKSIINFKGNELNISTKRRIIFVTGGSLGSHSINIVVKKILKKLLSKYFVIHQTGSVKEFADYDNLINYKKRLPEDLKHNYMLKEHFNDFQIGEIYNKADILVSRAGANTVFELISLQKPSVLIPLPWSANKEQQRQAELLKEFGVCEVFYQNQNPLKLNTIIDSVVNNIFNYKNNFKKISYLNKRDASKKIAKQILKT
ncbi:MAG: UDP-N-acetylglucosamine--N-acetylmuramyl-(pentapeptide) pyrophosphoryl-undecaprenol N-acetylglucosamine transferase [Patescibacteria group bacterium]